MKAILLLCSSIICVQSIDAQDSIPNDLGGPRFVAWQNDDQYLAHAEFLQYF